MGLVYSDRRCPFVVETKETIWVEVAYARPDSQALLKIQVRPGSTIETAIRASGILDRYPEIALTDERVGIFGKPLRLTDPVKGGDRIEIYRPLRIDPMAARRVRAQKR
jgi:putative ubiquitin-RnfH superfamily antitoxin RatB of RatAB toxin-antitoxin module